MGINRDFFLRLMIGALICAAAFGVLAVFTGSWDVVGRIVATSFIVGVGAALLMPVSTWLDSQKNTAAGLTGMAVVLAQIICFVTAVWIDRYSYSWRFFAIGMVLFPTGWPLSFLLLGQSGKPLSFARRLGLMIFPATFLLALAAIGLDMFGIQSSGAYHYGSAYDKISEKLWLTASALWTMGILSMLSIAGWSDTDRQHWRWTGVGAALLAFLIITYAVWAEITKSNGVLDVIISVAVFIAYANQILRLRLPTSHRFLRLGTVILTGTTIAICCMYSISMKDRPWDADYLMGRAAIAGIILSACLTLSLLILARINRGVNIDTSKADETTLETNQLLLTCPRCQLAQRLALGESHCGRCQLRFTIEVEEPRCTKCGFLLYKCTSENCPECGTPTGTVGAVQG